MEWVLLAVLVLGLGNRSQVVAPPPPVYVPPSAPPPTGDKTADDWRTAIGLGGSIVKGVIGLIGDGGSGGKRTTDGDSTYETADAKYYDDPDTSGSTGLYGDIGKDFLSGAGAGFGNFDGA